MVVFDVVFFFVDDVFLFDFSEKENSLLIVGILESTIPGDPIKRSIRLMVGLTYRELGCCFGVLFFI